MLLLVVSAAVAHGLALAAQQQFFLLFPTKPTRGCRALLGGRRQRQHQNWLWFIRYTRRHLGRKAPALGLVRRPEILRAYEHS